MVQKSDWKLHRVECQALSKVDKERIKSLTPTMRLMVKLYLRRKLQDEKVLVSTFLLLQLSCYLVNILIKWILASLKRIWLNFRVQYGTWIWCQCYVSALNMIHLGEWMYWSISNEQDMKGEVLTPLRAVLAYAPLILYKYSKLENCRYFKKWEHMKHG